MLIGNSSSRSKKIQRPQQRVLHQKILQALAIRISGEHWSLDFPKWLLPRLQLAMPARNQRWLQKFLQSSATIVMRTRDLCQRVVALARKMTLKAPWECEMPCMYHLLLCHLFGPATDGGIWTASYEQTGTWAQPRQLYELEGTLYKEICIILAGFWKLFIPIRPCSGAMPFNLEMSLCSLCYHCWLLM